MPKNIDIPVNVLVECTLGDTCKASIDKFCCDIAGCIEVVAVSSVIPMRECHVSQFNVPGWHTYVRDRVYFKRGVQPKCGVQDEKCGAQNSKMWSPE